MKISVNIVNNKPSDTNFKEKTSNTKTPPPNENTNNNINNNKRIAPSSFTSLSSFSFFANL